MELRDYRVMPDEGMYEKIERRLRRRRMARVGGVTAAALLVVAGAAVWLAPKESRPQTQTVVAAKTEVVPVTAAEAVTVQTPTILPDSTAERHKAVPARPTAVADSKPLPLPLPNSTLLSLPGEQLALPSTSVALADTPVSTLILESNEPDGREPAALPTKVDDPDPVIPHRDNLLVAPNIIAPMSDNADNRIFKVQSNSPVGDFHMAIFNRGGRQVFSSNDINIGWDVTTSSSTVPQGTYVWVARFRDSDGVLRQEKGTVTVVR